MLYSSDAGVRDWLARVMPAKYADRVTWVSSYVFRQAIASSLTDDTRRVLLVGEAAHLFAPFGARGLNSGVADALMAARAIDAALRAGTPEAAARAVQEFAVPVVRLRPATVPPRRPRSPTFKRHRLCAAPSATSPLCLLLSSPRSAAGWTGRRSGRGLAGPIAMGCTTEAVHSSQRAFSSCTWQPDPSATRVKAGRL